MSRRLALALLAGVAVNALLLERRSAPGRPAGGRLVGVAGTQLHAIEEGSREEQPIVLLHGLSCSSTWWTPCANRLAARHHVIRLDLLGHGGSDKPATGYSIADHADAVAAAIDELGLRPALLVGHSMGALVAVEVAERRRDLVTGLVDLDEPARYGSLRFPPAARLYVTRGLGPLLHLLAERRSRRHSTRALFAAGFEPPPGLIAEQAWLSYAAVSRSFRGLRTWMRECPVDARPACAQTPLMVIWGDSSRLVAAGARRTQYVDAKRVVLAGVGHSPQLEAADTTAHLVADFAARLAAQPRPDGGRSNQKPPRCQG